LWQLFLQYARLFVRESQNNVAREFFISF
jgi:hypothetical protein